MRTNSSILLIGSGRLALHLQYWFQQSNQSSLLTTWSRRDSFEKLQDLAAKADLIWLAISDSAIVDFYDQRFII